MDQILSVETRKQLTGINLDPHRPLIICDVDEVVVQFIAGLEDYLQKQDLWLDTASFALNGNIKEKVTGLPVDTPRVAELLTGFFHDCSASLNLIEGARDSLTFFANAASIVFLTNIPHESRENRRRNLDHHGLKFPMISNTGPKGPAIAEICADHRAPVFFIDDIPNYLMSAARHYPTAKLVHFTHDQRFARHLPPLQTDHFRCDNWSSLKAHIAPQLGL